jgi:glycosyltransferase involved in cell wall biosynthesis
VALPGGQSLRQGVNPYKLRGKAPPAKLVTTAVVISIPLLSGYWAESLEILRLSLSSFLLSTDPESSDLLVFDNGSCEEVVSYLRQLADQGNISFLVQCAQNIGKVAAWNFIISAAPGEYLAYADSDVYFEPGWLEKEMAVIHAFPRVGMVSGQPPAQQFGDVAWATSRWQQAIPGVRVERGWFMTEDQVVDWGMSLGAEPVPFLERCRSMEQVRLTSGGVSAYPVAGHFQFLSRLSTLRSVLPLAAEALVGKESVLDKALEESGYLRLSVTQPVVRHLGNRLKGEAGYVRATVPIDLNSRLDPASASPLQPRLFGKLLRSRRIRGVLRALHNTSHDLLLHSDKKG